MCLTAPTTPTYSSEYTAPIQEVFNCLDVRSMIFKTKTDIVKMESIKRDAICNNSKVINMIEDINYMYIQKELQKEQSYLSLPSKLRLRLPPPTMINNFYQFNRTDEDGDPLICRVSGDGRMRIWEEYELPSGNMMTCFKYPTCADPDY